MCIRTLRYRLRFARQRRELALDLDVVQRADTFGLEVVRYRGTRAVNRSRPCRKLTIASPQPAACEGNRDGGRQRRAAGHLESGSQAA
jgi:hypothetical protein